MNDCISGYVSSACSSGGPSSPTSVSNPDDIMRKLKQLIARSESTVSESSQTSSEPPSQVESPRNQSDGVAAKLTPPSPAPL